MQNTIWKFETENFAVVMTAEEEHDLDLSWDDDGSVREGLESGEFVAFCAKCVVLFRGAEVGVDYLGNCVYRNFDEFRDHIGRNAKGYGSYFSDMVREAIREARDTLTTVPRIRTRAAH